MEGYISYDVFQRQLKKHFFATGAKQQFREVMISLCESGLLSQRQSLGIPVNHILGDMSNEEINKLIDHITIKINVNTQDPTNVVNGKIK